jgi:hypothetical protein
VILDGTRYQMWTDLGLYATSLDGLAWRTHGFVTGLDDVPREPHVLKEDGTYEMWFRDHDGIRYATSSDGLTWRTHGVSLAHPGAFSFYTAPSVVRDGTTLRMWYGNDFIDIHTATSP